MAGQAAVAGWAILAGTVSVVLGLLLLRVIDRLLTGTRGRNSGAAHDSADWAATLQPIVFLFRDRILIDATAPARMLLDGISGSDDPWLRLLGWLSPRFPDAVVPLASGAPQALDLLGDAGQGSARLRLATEPSADGTLRVRLTVPTARHAGILVDSLAQQALEEELELMRGALDETPMLAWRHDAEGRTTWANGAYMRCANLADASDGGGEADPAAPCWPLPRLFDIAATPGVRRAAITVEGRQRWYDCHAHASGDQTMVYALPADAAVRAERSLREFVQTLTKTFADLPIGLAIFDRDRHLQLFNPALIDLTGLPTGFLTARPTLFDLLDQLRETRMVPEPRDFRTWRQQMANLEAAAATGHHVETWSLPGGQTYRVTGRPHPDGAVAFLFEDITSEISLTRKFRAELLLGTQVLDALDDALAVFAPNGSMILSNRAFASLWGAGIENLPEAVRAWEARTSAGPGLAALRDRLSQPAGLGPVPEGTESGGAMAGPTGGLIGWTVSDLVGGRTIVRFSRSGTQALAGPADTRTSVSDAEAGAAGATPTASSTADATDTPQPLRAAGA